MIRVSASVLALLLFGGCGFPSAHPHAQERSYLRAVGKAATATQERASSDLIPVVPGNTSLVWDDSGKRLRVVTWKSRQAYEQYLLPASHTASSEKTLLWVTVVPQVRQFCQGFQANQDDASRLESRLKQYLGLHPAWRYDLFVELWVDPADLFRPCVDPEIVDTRCELAFSAQVPAVSGIRDYPEFFRNLYFTSFRTAPGVPWTGLGYTFDWGNPDHSVGASEFILRPGAGYEIAGVHSTVDYCGVPAGTERITLTELD